MYTQGVLVQVEHSKFGLTKSSGLQINNVVIIHGNILAPICLFEIGEDNLTLRYNSIIKDLQSNRCENIKFKVFLSNSNYKEYNLVEAKFNMLFNYPRMLEISNEISNWAYLSETTDEEKLCALLLPKFILLSIGQSSECNNVDLSLHKLLDTLKHSEIYPGMQLIVESTPYGSFSFFNSWSRGIVSKVIGSVNDGIITDARLVTGCEGSPLFLYENGVKSTLIGIVVHTIAWCNGEWIGFSLALSIKHLLKSVLQRYSDTDYIPFNLPKSLPVTEFRFDELASSVVFVRSLYKWGSGVVIDAENGLILTCSHVIGHGHNAVTVFCNEKKMPATVVFAAPLSTQYDLALISVGRVFGLKAMPLADSGPVLGERVIAVGYPLSTEQLVNLNNAPTFSSGCVAKVSQRGGPLQTTCCTQSGLSGGALVRPTGHLLGIIVSNLRHGSTTMPCFSFNISVQDFREPIENYLRTKDKSFLEALCHRSCAVQMEWSLIDCKL